MNPKNIKSFNHLQNELKEKRFDEKISKLNNNAYYFLLGMVLVTIIVWLIS